MVASVFQGLLNTDGRISTGVGPAVSYLRGLPLNADGSVVTESAPVVRYDQGIPFTASGAVAVENVAVAVEALGGTPYTASGALAISPANLNLPIAFYHQGVPYDPGHRLSVGAGAAPGWYPSELFGSGEAGSVFDPSALDTVFEDVGGLVPASVNSTVARLNNRVNEFAPVLQATLSRQPILRESSGLYALEFDGVNDGLWASLTENMFLPPWEYWCAMLPVSSTVSTDTTQGLFSQAAGSAGSFNAGNNEGVWTNTFSANRVLRAASRVGSGTTHSSILSSAFVFGVPSIAGGRALLGPNQIVASNIDSENAVAATISGFPGITGHRIGNTTTALRWHFYGGVSINRTLTPTELASLVDWFKSKAGIP